MRVLDSDTYKLEQSKTRAALREIRNALLPRESGTIYGFHINSAQSDPANAVTYLADAVGMTPAAMDFTTGLFNYGSWRDAFFMPRPCMLKYDGTVDYYLDPNDYGKRYDGATASDVADDTYAGNAMMEWGRDGRIIWYKIVPDSTDPTSADVFIADYKVDDDYRAWSFFNNKGKMVEHFYTPIYNGTLDGDGRLRSISGKAYTDLCQGKTAAQEVTAAELNNPTGKKLWYTEVYADIILINILLILIGKSLNTQGVFGNGRISQASAASSMLGTGTMNTKGLFWGSSGNNDGVKVFGMENWWGNQWRRYAGHVMVDYVQKYKMTRTSVDGSSADDYAKSTTTADYAGYLTGATGPSSNNYVKAMEYNADCFQTKTVGDGATALYYYCDYWYHNSGLRYACRGGYCNNGAHCGAFYVFLDSTPSYAYWSIGAAPSCKPEEEPEDAA